ncbi:MAG: saccharopine dehydrogenase NADP-binding domain-containing protein [Cyclobacteriaceae bacterium]
MNHSFTQSFKNLFMSKVLIIGAGGVGNVVTHKCAEVSSVFTEIMLASRTKAKCDQIAERV